MHKKTPLVHHHTHEQAHAQHGHHHDHTSIQVGRVLTVRPASGLSGDMMLAGLARLLCLQPAVLETFIEEVGIPELKGSVSIEEKSVHHIAGVGCKINLPHEHAHRTFADIAALISASSMPEQAMHLAVQTFTLLAQAEGAVHGKKLEEVTFHEVGALDSILDICLVCRLFVELKPTKFICGALPMADGIIHCAHGHICAPSPAVLHLLEGVPVCSFDDEGETVTPTAIALLKALGATFGPWPSMTVQASCISYGTKEFTKAANGAVWVLGDVSY